MIFESTLKLNGTKTGKNEDGKYWYLLKLLDNEDKHINIFVTKSDFDKVQIGNSYTISFTLYYNLKKEKYFLSGKVVA